jgi:protein SCO1/2
MITPGSGLRLAAFLFALTILVWATPSLSHKADTPARLPKIGPAPEFTLTSQDSKPLSLSDLKGQVVALTFIFTTCPDTCPLLTHKMAGLQKRLGRDFGSRVHFVSITVDPERDTPEVLRRYASDYSANLAGWSFLTGSPAQIQEVVKQYGVFAKKQETGNVDHTFLTSVIDQSGTLRVQYMGARLDPKELLGDIRSLLREGKGR